MSISVVYIALNEDGKIGRSLESVKWADERIVVDSGSTDTTVRAAKARGAVVYERAFDDFSSQKNFALSKATNEWVLFLDADEVVSRELACEISSGLELSPYDGYFIPRKNIIFGREMRFGGHRGDRHLRLFRKAKAAFEGPIHEKVVVSGSLGELKNPLIHYSTANRREYLSKLRLYTDLEAGVLVKSGRKVTVLDVLIRPPAVFLKRYVFQAGFLDGMAGLKFYVLSAYYVLVKYLKALKLQTRG